MTIPQPTYPIQTQDLVDHVSDHTLNMPIIDVRRDFGAMGAGADEATELQAAYDAVPSSGAIVYWPTGDYVSSVPLVPKSRTWTKGEHVPGYQSTENATSSCKLRPASGFTGTGLIKPAADTRYLRFSDFCLAGNNIGTNVHGIDNPLPTSGELSWVIDNLQINGFTGSGFHGSMHVATINNLHIDHNHGWGILVDGSHKWADVKMANSFTYFNRTGGWNFDSTSNSIGLFDVVNARVERSGGNHANTNSPHNSNAPGIRFRKMQNSSFTNVSTDANTGEGLNIEYTAAAMGGQVLDLTWVNCTFKRDAYGSGTDPDRAGVLLKGFATNGADAVQYNGFVNCKVITGRAKDDNTFPTNIHPNRGVWVENTQFIDWVVGRSNGRTSAYHMGTGGQASNFRMTLIDYDRLLMTIPRGSTASRPTDLLLSNGSCNIYADSTLNKIIHRDASGNWRDAMGTIV